MFRFQWIVKSVWVPFLDWEQAQNFMRALNLNEVDA